MKKSIFIFIVILCFFLFSYNAFSAPVTYDFSNLASSGVAGFDQPDNNKFLVSDTFVNDGSAMYYESAEESVSGMVIKPDYRSIFSTDIIDMQFSALSGKYRIISLTIRAYNGASLLGTVSVSTYTMTPGTNYSLVNHFGMSLSNFTEVTELQFDLTAHGDRVYNINFETITTDNEVAYVPGTEPTVQAYNLAAANTETDEINVYSELWNCVNLI
jgi:hypothetical protein